MSDEPHDDSHPDTGAPVDMGLGTEGQVHTWTDWCSRWYPPQIPWVNLSDPVLPAQD